MNRVSYRVLAKRKDLVGKRMERVTVAPAPKPSAPLPRVRDLRDLVPDISEPSIRPGGPSAPGGARDGQGTVRDD